MDIWSAITARRSIKAFADRPVDREAIEQLLAAAVHAPNHRLTQPWRFLVLGPAARRAFGEVLGARKAKKIEDPAAAQATIEKVAAAEAAIPVTIAVSVVVDANPEVREEDYAATMMAVQNILLAAHDLGLGTHLRSGAVMDDPRTRAALAIPDGERVVVMIWVGYAASVPEAKPRKGAAELTRWLP
ncbi:MAG TPA: nitroreductase [Gemmatimonadales bacterium]|jgi:nitroreductase